MYEESLHKNMYNSSNLLCITVLSRVHQKESIEIGKHSCIQCNVLYCTGTTTSLNCQQNTIEIQIVRGNEHLIPYGGELEENVFYGNVCEYVGYGECLECDD